MSKPTIKNSTVVALNHWTKIIKEDLLYESGNTGEYLIVERDIAVGIIPLFIKNNEPYTAMVKQYRHPINIEVFQFPMGSLEKGCDSKKHAMDELKQETGLKMGKITTLKEYYVEPRS